MTDDDDQLDEATPFGSDVAGVFAPLLQLRKNRNVESRSYRGGIRWNSVVRWYGNPDFSLPRSTRYVPRKFGGTGGTWYAGVTGSPDPVF
jgi:hypothetical protein